MGDLLGGLRGRGNKERPVHAVIQRCAWNARGCKNIGAALSGNTSYFEPVLDMLAEDAVAHSIRKTSGASSKFIHRLLDACSLFHRSPDYAK